MKPGILKTDNRTRANRARLSAWFTANGVRHYIPENAKIVFTGNRLIIPTFDIERVGQKRTNWAVKRLRLDEYGDFNIPVKTRTYRVRVPFGAIK